jgi:hypothetical protein
MDRMGELEPKINITATALRVTAKALLGSIPVAGPPVAAVIDEVMPVLRAYRMESFTGELGVRLEGVPGDVLRLRMQEPGRFDLLEDGLWQAARTSSHARHGHIANIVANGLKAEDAEELDRRHILRLLGELNDVEVLLLTVTRSRACNCRRNTSRSTRRRCITSPPHSAPMIVAWPRKPRFTRTTPLIYSASIFCGKKSRRVVTNRSSLSVMAPSRGGELSASPVSDVCS